MGLSVSFPSLSELPRSYRFGIPWIFYFGKLPIPLPILYFELIREVFWMGAKGVSHEKFPTAPS